MTSLFAAKAGCNKRLWLRQQQSLLYICEWAQQGVTNHHWILTMQFQERLAQTENTQAPDSHILW